MAGADDKTRTVHAQTDWKQRIRRLFNIIHFTNVWTNIHNQC